MGFRDIIVAIMAVLFVPLALIDAYWGLLAYCVMSFMKPQSLAWSDTVQAARFTLYVALALIFRAMLTPGRRVRFNGPAPIFLVLWAWVALTTVTSANPNLSLDFLEIFSKIAVAGLLLTGLVRTRQQFKWLAVTLALCPGLYAFRLGLYFLRGGVTTGGGGPLGMDNNDTALFIATGLPMLIFGATQVVNRWGRWGMYGLAALGVPAVVVGGSRGGILAMGVTLFITMWRRWSLVKALAAAVILLPIVVGIIPQQTKHRYGTILNYRVDASAQARLRAWETARRMAAAHPVLGIGPGTDNFLKEYNRYKLLPEDEPRVAHSVWFSMLAGSGYPGLALYGALILMTYVTTWRVRRMAMRTPEGRRHWAWAYAAMIECAIVAFAIAATFISQVGFEYIYAIYLLSVPLYNVSRQEQEELLAPMPEAALSPAPALVGA